MSRTIAHYLRNPHSPLRPLVARAREQDRLKRRVQACLPAALRPRITNAALRGTALAITVTSPAWSAEVRYRAPDLLRQMRDELGGSIHKVIVRVQPEAPQTAEPLRRAQAPSPENARLIERTAEHIPDPDLQRALRRLARRQRS